MSLQRHFLRKLQFCGAVGAQPLLTARSLSCSVAQCSKAEISKVSTRQAKRLEKLGIGPDGKPLPTPNYKKVFPRLYKALVVNQDGSTFTINHRYPHRIITLPLDLSTLSAEELERRERAKLAAKKRVYTEEEGLEEDKWDQDAYRDLL